MKSKHELTQFWEPHAQQTGFKAAVSGLLTLIQRVLGVAFKLILKALREMLLMGLPLIWGVLRSVVVGSYSLMTMALVGSITIGARTWINFLWVVEKLSEGPSGLRELGRALDPWVRAFWSLVFVVVAGLTIFFPAVQRSIASTPHPELVYTIFGVALASAGLAAMTLDHYLREGQLAKDLLHMNEARRRATIEALTDSDYTSALKLSMTPMGHQPGEHRDLVESEMIACESHADSRLNLSSYLGGSLIGIGLVGTFVGLLAALADLSGVFSALMGGNAAATGNDPMAMFSGMLVKLQEPMKGMATAFVASLYGLMGSLLLGLVVYSVRKAGQQSAAQMRAFMRDQDRLTTLAMHEHPSHDFDANSFNRALDVLNKHQEVLELKLTDLIQVLKNDKASTNTFNEQK